MTEAPNKDGGDDLAILYPDRETAIAGVHVVMREYGFAESLRLQPLIGPLVRQIAAAADPAGELQPDAIMDVFGGDNAEIVFSLIAHACNQPVEWVKGLGSEGDELFALWWVVNKDFFTRRVMQVVLMRGMARAGAKSSPASSPTGTPPAGSGTTPAVN